MSNLPLQPLVWIEDADSSVAQHEFIEYRVIPDHDSFGKFAVRYKDSRHRPATGFATIDEAKQWAWNHYNEKMQPYVKPMPTWIDASERLPEMYKRVLIKADCYLVAGREPKSERNKDWGVSGDWMWSIVNDNWCDAHMVTHWMPIPEFSTMQNLHKGGDCE